MSAKRKQVCQATEIRQLMCIMLQQRPCWQAQAGACFEPTMVLASTLRVAVCSQRRCIWALAPLTRSVSVLCLAITAPAGRGKRQRQRGSVGQRGEGEARRLKLPE